MVKKHSESKVSKLFHLYFQGYSQTEIANKLKVTQASISIHVSKFKSLVEQQGIMAAAEEYGIMNQVEVLYDLAVDLKKAKSTVEEAKTGLNMVLLFQECGVEEDEFADLIQACKEMDNEGCLFAAVELSQLEDENGTSYEGIVDDYKSTAKQLVQAQQELQDIHGEISSSNEELENIDKQKKLATQDLKAHMDKVGVDMHRLKMVEALALTLKEAGIPNQALPAYIKLQQFLHKTGISIDFFATIIDKVNVATSPDHGKQLFSLLSEYGNLSDANKALQLQIESLTKQSAGLEQQATLKGKVEVELSKLKAEKASLEPHIADLHTQYQAMVMLQNDIAVLAPEKTKLEQMIGELKMRIVDLNNDIEIKEKEVSDLKELGLKRNTLRKDIAELQDNFEHDQKRWEIYQAFLELVLKGSIVEMEEFSEVLPSLLEDLKKGEYKPELMKSHILQMLAGPELLVFKCMLCKESFRVGRPVPGEGYHCPTCGLTHGVKIDKDATAMLKELFSPQTSKNKVIVKPLKIVAQPKTSDGNI